MTLHKYPASSLVEVLIAISCICLILAPTVQYKFNSLQTLQRSQQRITIQKQASYIFMLIEDEIAYGFINEKTIPSEDQAESSMFAFNRQDGKYVRYFVRNGEVVKDFNYSVYNAVSISCFSSFRVFRKDNDQCCIITVQLIDKDGHEYQQSFNVKKPKT